MKILIIDDSIHIRFQIKTFLENSGFTDLILKESARSAISDLFLSKRSGKKEENSVDLIIMDVVMPELNGIDALYEFRKIPELKDVPIIIITAKNDMGTLDRAFEAGASDFIRKPLNRVEVLARVRSLLQLKEEMDRRLMREKELSLEIVDRMKVEHHLRISEEKYRNLIDTAMDIILTIDSHLNITHINPEGIRMTGYSPEELSRMKISHIIPPEDVKTIRKKLFRKLRRPDIRFFFSTEVVPKNGPNIPVEFSTSLIRKKDRPEGFLIVARNLTDRLRMEKALLIARKLETSMRLSAGIAHDLNNLLSGIYGYIQLVQIKTDPGSDVFPYIGSAVSECERAAQLAGQFLSIAKIDSFSLSYRSMVPVIATFFESIIQAEGVRGRVCIEEPLKWVRFHDDQITELFRILVNNAKDAMVLPKSVELMAANVTLDEEFSHIHARVPKGDYVKLAFTDYGTGIHPDILTKLFDPYFSTKEMGSQKGMGLSLTIAQAIVYHHGGFIMIDSVLGEWTTCSVLFPVPSSAVEIGTDLLKA